MFRDFDVEERKEESSGGGINGNDGTVCNLRRSDFSIKIRVAWFFPLYHLNRSARHGTPGSTGTDVGIIEALVSTLWMHKYVVAGACI